MTIFSNDPLTMSTLIHSKEAQFLHLLLSPSETLNPFRESIALLHFFKMASPGEDYQSGVQSKGIYYGIPKYDPSLKGLKAIVFGASGISGNFMLNTLGEAPERWEEVIAISRRPPVCKASNIRHHSLDLLQEPEKVAESLKAQVSHVWVTLQFRQGYICGHRLTVQCWQ